MNFNFKVLTSLVAMASTLLIGATSAQGAPGDTIALYFSAPFVTGSHVAEGAVTEDFNGYANGATSGSVPCPTSIPNFATVTYAAGNCTIGILPGTSPGSGEQAIGVPLSSYVNKTLDTTFTFQNSVKYVGFWWMMGSNGNNVEFLDASGTSVASLNVNDVVTFLGANASVTNADTRTVNTVEGGTHLKKYFYRSPGNYTGTVSAPVMNYNQDSYANEPWIYLNLFVTGNVNVAKVRFSGANFEMDNLTVSTQESGPRGDMVLVKEVLGTPPVGQAIEWNPTNTNHVDTSNTVTPSAPAALTTPTSGGGAITYSVVNAGTSGCTVDPSTGVITYTAIGQCLVRATAAAVPGAYYTAWKDVEFTFAVTPVEEEAPVEETTPVEEEVRQLANTGLDAGNLLIEAFILLMLGAASLSGARKRSNTKKRGLR